MENDKNLTGIRATNLLLNPLFVPAVLAIITLLTISALLVLQIAVPDFLAGVFIGFVSLFTGINVNKRS